MLQLKIPHAAMKTRYRQINNSYMSKVSDTSRASLEPQMVKESPAMWEAWVPSLGWEDPLEEGTATLSSVLAWEIPWTEEPGGLQARGFQRVVHD